MNKYKYQTSGKKGEEIWVCEVCKKGKTQLILAGKWKLVDRSSDDDIKCFLCEENEVEATNRSSAANKI